MPLDDPGSADDELELLPDGEPVGERRSAHVLPALETGDADHEELVEVAGEDRQELHPLEQRQCVVLGELEDAR